MNVSAPRIDLQERLKAVAPEARCLESKIGRHFESEVLVKVPNGQDSVELCGDYGAELIEQFRFPQGMAEAFGGQLLHLRMPKGITTGEGIALLEKDPRVLYAEPNDTVHSLPVPSSPPPAQTAGPSEQPSPKKTPDDLDNRLWGLKTIQAEQAWEVTTGKREGGPILAVVDSGIDLSHADLVGNLWNNPGEVPDGRDNDGNDVVDDLHGFNAINKSGNPQDDNHHGSHVAGTIGAVGNNGVGVVGVNWQGNVMAVKFLSADGKGATSDAIKGIAYAADKGARICNHSWGSDGGWGNRALEDAMRSSPSLHVAAAGNDGRDIDKQPSYPAAFELANLVTVAATGQDDRLASFSNYGARSVDVAAPGVDIYSSIPGGGYTWMSGTSMATPHVVGVAGLIASAYPQATNEEIKARLMASVDIKPELQGRTVSGGRLNAASAVEADSVAPAPIQDLAVQARASGEVHVTWTATGDDGRTGRAGSYLLKNSTDPVNEGTFDGLPAVMMPPPGPAGQAESRDLLCFPQAEVRTLNFGLKAVDNVGNRSPLATATVRVPAASVALDDDMDGFFNSWSGNGWGRVSEDGRGKVWTDSPSGNYENSANRALISPDIDLAGLTGSAVTFDFKHDLELNFDKVLLEASSDGTRWTELRQFTGNRAWTRQRVDLSAFDGRKIKLRFRLVTDDAINRDGFYLDRVVVAGNRS